ncbi:hypothetical protein LIPSTDRAFT_4826 [Lipomyces starkeyi NRRL Y-11557]|uniref:Carrier domain-containing protein n=1 Tax=Lipomyces starkeyi NRRL Y-11557 TaxID=675824 RepID=A0A1E3Q265_LIPST|nr:hypothetical protein LIPSTDRAFT_4826 [Lipomyces starkeyi NRRL Y-11557]
MTDQVIITPFPRLLHNVQDANLVNATHCESFTFDNALSQREELIRAWGCLLHRYTLEPVVAFLVVEESTTRTVTYDNSKKTLETHDTINIIDVKLGTAIGFGAADLPAVQVSMNLISGVLLLKLSLADFPAAFSTILCSQISAIFNHGTATDIEELDGLSILNCPSSKIDGPCLLHHLPDFTSTSTAIEFYNKDSSVSTMAYDELNRLSSVLARTVYAKSATESKIVPILIPQCLAMYVGVLGVLRAGKAFCPLDPDDTPRDRIQFIFEDSKADIVLVTSGSADLVVGMGIDTIVVELDDLKGEDHDGFEDVSVIGDDVAYCMFTSGSTGWPKGVLVTHTNATQAILAHTFVPSFQRFLNFASLTFDVSVLEIFLPWHRGATLVSAHRPLLLSDLTNVINRMQVDSVELTPTVASLLKHDEVPTLRVVMTIGESLTAGVIQQFGCPGLLYNTYGPTEATIQCTAAVDGTSNDSVEGDIGAPLTTVGAMIADTEIRDHIKPLPVGWAGELVVAGSQVAKGYLNRAELTESVFLNDNRYGRCYRTGDLARILPNGRIIFIGRIFDGQVKVRGRRIELGEIEYVCGRGAVACVLQSRIVVVTDGDVDDARRSVERTLPSYMLPHHIWHINKIPLLASGKTDRKRIYAYVEELLEERSASEDLSEEYASVVERTLAQTVKEVVGTLPGPEVSLRSIGIDSVGAMMVISQVRRILWPGRAGISLGVADVLVHDTIRQISVSCLADVTESRGVRQIHNLLSQYTSEFSLSDDVIGIYPTTSLQRSMLFESMRDSRLYSNFIRFIVRNETSSDRIIDGIRTVIDNNEILRTGFLATNAKSTNDNLAFVQVVYADSRHLYISDDCIEKFTFHDMQFPPLRIRITRREEDAAWVVDLVIHHAIYDGWAFDMFLKQLEDATFAEAKVTSYVQFREVMPYILDVDGNNNDFWKGYLRNAVTNCIPKLMPPRSQPFDNFVDKLSVDIDLSSVLLSKVCRKFKFTAQSVFQLAWAHVLSGLFVPGDKGSMDVVFGTLVSRRVALAGSRLDLGLGPMFATLPFRVSHPSSGITIAAVLEQLSSAALLVMRNSDTMFTEVVKLLSQNSVGTLCSAKLGSLFAWQQSVSQKCENITIAGGFDRLEFEILLEVEPRDANFRVSLTYHTSKLSKSHAESLLQQIESLATFIIAFTEADISTITSVVLNDHALAVSNSQPRDFNELKISAMDLFDLQCEDIAIQILQENGSLRQVSYRELHQISQGYASILREHGVDHGDFVGVVISKSIELYAIITAIWSLGAVYIPVDIATPVARLNSIMQRARVSLCCVTEPVPGLEVQLEIPDYSTVQIRDEVRRVESLPLDIAYVIFTSGSTGEPKGIKVSHDNLVNNILQLSELYPAPKQGSKMLQFCSIGFDVSIFEVVYSLHHHMVLFSATKDVILPHLSEIINDYSITHLSMTTNVASLLDAALVKKVECIVLAGEAMTSAVLRFWEPLPAIVIDAYGPSEMTNVCTAFIDKKFGDDLSNIGLPFPNTSCFILEPESTNILPIGAVGELAFGGHQVAAGYLNSQELTAEKFVDLGDYGTVYRTGDCARMIADGSIVLLGRMDQQVKIRGQRVELDEINNATTAVSDVKHCVTILEDERLVSFILAGGNDLRVAVNVRDALEATLPAYMVPSDIIVVDKMPMNMNGKVDSGPLTALLGSHTEASGGALEDLVIEVGTYRERVFADALVESVRNVSSKDIRLGTPLLRYGLDSISAIRFIGHLRKSGYNLLISDIVRNASIRTIVQKCNAKSDIVDTSAGDKKIRVFASEVKSYVSSGGVDLSNVESILPCTAMQETLLGSHESYTNSFLLKLADDVDLLRVKCAWESVASSREILRTAFVDAGPNSMSRSFAQVVFERNRLQWQDVEYREYREMVDFLHSMKFTIQPTCPYLLTLFSGACGHYLCISMHHALFDGYALNLLLLDVVQNFSGHPIPRRTSFYGTIENIESVDTSHGVSFFTDLLRGHEGLSFPKLSTSAANEFPTLTCDAKLYSRISLSAFESAVKESGSTVCPIVQTAWAKLLSLITGANDVVFGSIASGRGTFPGSDDVVGPIFSSYPVRAKLSSTSTNAEMIMQLEHLEEESAKYPFTPIREVLKKVASEQPGIQRLFDTMLILQYIRTVRNGFDNEIWKCAEEGNDSGGLSLVLEIRRKQKQNVLEYFLQYKRSLLDESQASSLLDIFDLILYDITRRLQARVFDFTSFSTLELSISPAPTRLQAHGFKYLHSAFETNSIDLANHTALEFLCDDGQIQKWSYSELNTVADQLAAYLCQVYNIQVEDSLPTCVSKSPELYQSILAALKVGAAFCPIDTSMPASRISYMLQELQAKIILVNNASEACITQLVVSEALDILVVNISTLVFPDTDSVELDRNILDDSITAYRIFTSGTTGKPKAVEVEVRNAVQTILASKYLIPHNPKTRILQYSSPSFDMSIYDCFIAWSFGLTLCAADQQTMSIDLEEVINKLGVTLLDLTPSVASTIRRSKIPSVECLYCIGEILPQSIVDEWDGACVNAYGPTEASMCCTMTPASKVIRSAIIGHPFSTVSFYILSPATDDILPVLSYGELCIGGYQIARGYYRKKKLTTEKFIRLSGTPVFRTGDLGRMLTDGSIEFIGRMDDQVKLRGVRIELQEVNAVIRLEAETNCLFKDVCTLIMRQPTEARRFQLVSFMAIKTADESPDCYILEGTESIEGLVRIARDACKSFLPDYMVPTAIVPISRVPLSAAGKVSKAQLQSVYNQFSVVPKSTDGEATEYNFTEAKAIIRNVFAAVSGVPISDIRPNTTLYQLGMDSISATQIASQLKRAGLQFTAIDVLKCLTIEQLAKVVKDKTLTNDEDLAGLFEQQYRSCVLKEIGFSETDIAHVYPCTHTQEGILSQFQASAGLLYVNHIVFEVPDSVAYDRLFEAWMSLFKKYDILRTGFLELDHQTTFSYAQVVYTNPDFQWTKSKISTSNNLEEFVDQRVGEYCQYFLSHLHLPQMFLEYIDTQVGSSRYLLMTANHAIFDAMLLNIILSDVSGLLSGAQLTLRNSSYREVLNGILRLQILATGDSGSHFWKNSLGTASVTRIPNLNPFRTDVVDRKTVERQLSLTYEQLQECCAKLNVSVQSAGAATWAKILSSYVGEQEIVFGMVLSGQMDIESASLSLFPCLTTVPFQLHVSGLNSELLQAVEQHSRAILEFQHTPHKFIRDIVGLPESLYDSVFLYQKVPVPAQSIKSDPWRRLIDHGATEYTCSVEIEPLGNGSVTCRLHYNTSVVPTEQANIILQQFDYILRELLILPHRDCWRLDLPIDVVSVIPPKLDEIPSDVKLLHEFVERQSQLTPEAIALEFATVIEQDRVDIERWSYAELNRQANKVANYILSRFAVRPNDKIVTCFEKSPEASFAFVGILKAGCSFLAIDVTAPISRKRYIADDSGARCVLTHDRLLNELTAKEIKLPVVSVTSLAVSNAPDTPPSVHLQPENLCYCLYTSGSTGNPKGCMLTHENAVQGMLAFQRQFKGTWTKESRFLQFASFHFDVSVLEQFWSWSIGITVASAPRDIILRDLNLTINALGITHIDLTPSLAVLIKPEGVPSLCRGLFITGGDLLNQEVLNTWGDKKVIYNAYGPTEVTIGCTMRKQAPNNIRPSNIGQQFDNVGTVIVFPDTDIPVPKGAIGELCASGKLVGNGYIQHPDLTAQNFVHSERLGTKMYRTGDLVRLLPDLSFDFIGRKDTQVKLRGQRLEIGEINSVIKQSSEHVRDVVTLILKYSLHHRDQLVSFVAMAADSSYGELIPASPSTNSFIRSVFNFCASKLPMYMVPTYILPLQNIPLSINNKIDNEALAKLYTEATPETLGSYSEQNLGAESWNKVEVEIRDQVSSLIDSRNSSIGLCTTFFELGFDSISLVRLLKLLRKFYNHLTLSTLMRFPSIQCLAKHILENERVVKLAADSQNYGILNYHDQACCELDLNSEDIEYIIPCTPLQEGMIARALSSENDILYFNKFFFELYEEVDTSRLQQCWNAVVQQNQALRVSFLQTEIGVVQVILKDWTPAWLDYTNAIGDYRQLATNLLTEHWTNVKLSRPPLIFSVMSTGQSRLLFMGLFHALYDGTSMKTILDDVVKLYFYMGVPNRPSFVEAIYRIQSSVDIIAAKEFWTENFSCIELKQSRKLQKSAGASALIHSLCSLPYSKIQEGARNLRCTPQVLLQTAFAISLSRLQGTALSFGLVVSGRSFQDDLDNIAGPLFNTLPLAVDLSAFRTYRDIVCCLQQCSAQMMEYMHTPLKMIRKWLNVSAETDLFNALFVFQNTSASETEDSLWKSVPSNEYIADDAICFEVECSHELVNLTLGYLRTYIDDELAQSFLQYVDVTVNNIIREPDGAVDINCMLKQVYSDTHCQSSNRSLPPTDDDAIDSAVLEKLRRSVANIARIEKADVQDEISIFRYGLDSIDAIRLSASLVREAIDLPLITILKHPSIRSMAQALANTPDLRCDAIDFPKNISAKCALEEAAPHISEDCEDVYYCTPLQDGILTESLSSENTFYVNHDILLVEEHVDFDRLKHALLTTLKNNAIYRSKFVALHERLTSSPSHFGMAVLKEAAVDFAYQLVRDSTWTSELQSISNNISRSIDPFRSPPVHLQIIESETKRAIMLTMSHALYDGHSVGLFFSDVYEAYERSNPILRPHFGRLLSRIIAESQCESHISYWRAKLGGSYIEDFPDLDSRTDGTDRSILLCRAEMSSKVSPQVLSVFAKRNGVTFQTIGQTCWAILLSLYLGLSDVVFGTVLSGRTTEEDEQVQFPSMVTIPTRASIRGSFSSILRRMQHYVNTSRDHQYTPLSSIFQAVSAGRRLFHTLFIYQRINMPIHNLWQSIDGWSAVEYSVATEFEQLPNSMTWRVATKSSKVGQKSAEALVQQLDAILLQMLQSPESCNYCGALDSDDGLSLSSLVQLPYGALRHMINGKTFGGSTTLEGYAAQENLQVCVAEDHHRIVMRGCIGELCIVENANDEIKLIPTGVRARVLASGALKYAGLVEDIVSFEGNTLDLEKISRAVCGSSADIVKSRSLIAKIASKDIIVTFIISNSDQAGTASAAFRRARKLLDERVLPSYIIPLRSISLRDEDISNRNMLLHRFLNMGLKDLESFTEDGLCSGEWSGFEISLRKVLALVSGIDEAHIRRTDSIFHLGLDSISCIKLSNLLRADNIFLSVGEIVACESIESMAQLAELNKQNSISTTHTIVPVMGIQQYLDTERLSSEFGITNDMIQTVLPATPGQVYMLSGWQTSQDVLFISTFCYCSELQLDKSAIECVWLRLLENFPVLRTTFIATDCADFPILQLILKPEFVTHTLSCSPGFDSKSDVFFETVPVHLHISGHKIYLTIHHALYDAWSLRMIVSSLSDLYQDATKSAVIWLDTARNEFISLVNCHAESKREFWTSQLRDASTVDHAPYTSVRHGEFQQDVLISAPKLSSYCRKQGFSISSLLFAAYAVVYHREVLRSSSDEVVFGVYNSGRTENITNLSDLVYPTLNIHPLVVCIKPSLRAMAHDIQKTMLEINKESRSQVSLFDIKRWTGVSVNSTVNFLEGVGDVSQQKIGIFDHSDETFDAKGVTQNGKQLRCMIDKNLTKDAVKVNFDVELSLSDNKLNIGVFYREQALTGSDGKDIIARIAEVLENELTNH